MPREKKQSIIIVMIFVALGAAGVFLVPETTVAQIPSQILPSCNWEQGETYGFGAFVEVASRVMKLIWGILGSLALVMFIWGGFLWLTARGEEQQIKQGWDTLINAVIGILIVLGSWVIINTIILSLTNPTSWKVAQLFGDPNWNELAGGTICEQIAIRKAGTAPWSKGGGGGVTSSTPISPTPIPPAPPAPATEPVYEQEAQFNFGAELEIWPVTEPADGSVEIDPGLVTGTMPTALEEIAFMASLLPVPIAGPLASMGGKLIIAGAKKIGSKISFAGAKVIIKGCTKAAAACSVSAKNIVKDFFDMRAEELNLILKTMYPTPQAVPVRVR